MIVDAAVVLAAGEGTRLRPLTQNRPKPMLPAATKPILEHVFDQLIDAGLSELVVVVGYRRDRVQSHFGSTYRNVPITYVTQEKRLGTGHAVLEAESTVDGPCLAINGDQIVDARIISDVLAGHGDAAAATIGLLHRPTGDHYGGVSLEADSVRQITESPTSDHDYLLNAGVYVLEPAAFEAVRSTKARNGERHLVDGLSDLVETGEDVRGVVSEGLWVDATYPWDLLDVSFELFDAGFVNGDPTITGDETATVHETAVIREPVVLDRDCVIGPGAVVGPYTCLGQNTTVGSNAVVERSVVDADTTIGPNATVVECVTGTGVEIGPGSTVPGGPGDVRVRDTVYEDESLGALLADRVVDHGGVAYVPGALVGPETEIQTGTTIRGTIAGGTEVRS
jgi:UDP-N-acetylglucosamine diphosphorylase / glucose-1-phosphate thymidylyltransferase / UDP-N-acetylgalactosamine diphosphorylase / glucosamine-1-phosphate N-acetyltransferase / galactosamine-1-phosphate N-acetyltransferase